MRSEVISLTQVSQNYWFLRFTKPSGFSFQAGQYISLKVHSDGHRRTYSLSSIPSASFLELLADVSPMGLGSKFILSLKPGNSIDFLGPFGSFVIPDSLFLIRKIFLAGGSGIAPYLSMQASPILWSLRRKSDVFFVKNTQIFYSRQILVEYLISHLSSLNFYVCGSPSYVSNLSIFLTSIGVSRERLHTEKFV